METCAVCKKLITGNGFAVQGNLGFFENYLIVERSVVKANEFREIYGSGYFHCSCLITKLRETVTELNNNALKALGFPEESYLENDTETNEPT
jgi:hypothetical protein